MGLQLLQPLPADLLEAISDEADRCDLPLSGVVLALCRERLGAAKPKRRFVGRSRRQRFFLPDAVWKKLTAEAKVAKLTPSQLLTRKAELSFGR
ncbi:MAG: hypothetical protein IPJ65_43395 [Archangiaceae bacterium]|nr:hypothetical protein [Archangiaceae bacterium]